LSAVLQVCAYARHEVKIDLEGEQTSWPYVAMTMQLMDEFGVMSEVLLDKVTGEPRMIAVPQGKYVGTDYAVEPDASNASYFLAAAALHPGSKVTIQGLGKRSLQGDVGFADVLHQMGASLVFGRDFITVIGTETLEGVDIDLRNMPDMAQTLAVVAMFAQGTTRIGGLHTLRLKETDRVTALANELVRFGTEVEVEGDDLIITPGDRLHGAAVETYDDHRMAMSFALAGTKLAGVTIKNVECVNKTYPGYFADLGKVVGS
ncbi:MAG TPA: 3-phosphoshikimate 1-carboxyvinyltransferase, partial [Tepidisphaeraceae bacterium]|nr:3-phosphoshikimate 1-carboxyvinyltransferase [Tepidisphaeraceae bacterium]